MDIEKVIKALDEVADFVPVSDPLTDKLIGAREIVARLQSALPAVLTEFRRTQDLLFGLLDYFEPGNELDAINVQRERNRAVISKAEGDSNGNDR